MANRYEERYKYTKMLWIDSNGRCAQSLPGISTQRTIVGQRLNSRPSPFSKFSDKSISRIFLAKQQAGKCGRVDAVQLIDIDLGQTTGAHGKLRVCANAFGRDQQVCARHEGIDGRECAGRSEEKRKRESHGGGDVLNKSAEVLSDWYG